MKKYLRIILVTIMLTGIIFGCKKNNTPASKDYILSIKNKTWSGVLTYTGKTAEYYSVHFNADNSLVWSQLSGDYSGRWVINGKQLIMTFNVSGAEVTADISDDDRLINITDNTNSYSVNNGKLIENPNQPLDNTVWKGTITSGASKSLELFFMPGFKVVIQIGNVSQGQFTYKRSASGGAIQVSVGGMNPFFGVITVENEMTGSSVIPDTPWQATKQ